MKKWAFICLILLLFSCMQQSPTEVTQFSLPLPAGAPIINKAELKAGNDFSIGYANGNIRSDRVSFNWQASTDADFLCYKVFRDNSQKAVIGNKDSTTFTDSTLVQNSYYEFKVVTLSKRGTGISDSVRIKTPQFDPPLIAGYQIISSSSLKIFWLNRAESATSFTVERRHPDSTSYRQVATVNDTFYVDTNNITEGRSYRYRITAHSPYESTGLSLSYLVFVEYTMNAPTLLQVQKIRGSRRVQIDWIDNSTAEDGFRIYRKTTAGDSTLVVTVPTDWESYIDVDTVNSLVYNQTYFYRVVAYNQFATVNSAQQSVTINPPIFAEGFETGSLAPEWRTGGDADWQVVAADPYAGEYCVQSGPINDGQSTYLETTVNIQGNPTISFWYKVSSESIYDYLSFSINGVNYRTWSGEIGWQYYSTTYFGSGQTILRWTYQKDNIVSYGNDSAWIDAVIIE